MALPVRHTCCSSWEHKKHHGGNGYFEWAYWVCEEDEVEEIQEEDANELALLESLLLEFESKIDEMGCALATFFKTYWMDRMGQVLQEIQNRTLLEEEVQGAERLGISLRVEEENMQEDWTQLEYWFRKLDAVVA
ncbi:hypothetical protein CkaCkLH20_01688 [Colletotrichum karsti]|uniref:Uncharacterized protein n=1 Tax=Colletotrichum karsti TaxID=1095194 RepID=A0A9P6IEY1_9PEZI|nr:uncharacterized protein CkaCkLH20_01688 [Colletotrichum karsti]KAF9880646.1 hypothetical protein CkaCkLH20_01688 [Colletotrichum karsti]